MPLIMRRNHDSFLSVLTYRSNHNPRRSKSGKTSMRKSDSPGWNGAVARPNRPPCCVLHSRTKRISPTTLRTNRQHWPEEQGPMVTLFIKRCSPLPPTETHRRRHLLPPQEQRPVRGGRRRVRTCLSAQAAD